MTEERIGALETWLWDQYSGFVDNVRGRVAHSRQQRKRRDHPAHPNLSTYLDGALAVQGHHLKTPELEAFCLHLEDQV